MIISVISSMVVCSIAYILKGGQGDNIFKNWNNVAITKLGNKGLSLLFVIACLSLCSFFVDKINWVDVFLISVAWMGSVSPAVMFTSAVLGDFKESLKDGFVRGSVIGACMALSTGFIWFIPFGWLYGIVAYLGFKLKLTFWKLDAWAWTEVMIGAFCFGIPMGIYLGV